MYKMEESLRIKAKGKSCSLVPCWWEGGGVTVWSRMAGPQNQTGPSHPAIPLLGSKKELRGARARAPTALRAAGLREAQAEAAQGPTDRRPRGELRPSHAGGLSSGERRAAQRQRGGSRGHCWTGRTRGHIWACPVSGTLGSQIPKQETRWRESRAGVGGGRGRSSRRTPSQDRRRDGGTDGGDGGDGGGAESGSSPQWEAGTQSAPPPPTLRRIPSLLPQ